MRDMALNFCEPLGLDATRYIGKPAHECAINLQGLCIRNSLNLFFGSMKITFMCKNKFAYI